MTTTTPAEEQLEQVMAVLGLVVKTQGGEVRIPLGVIEEGLPENSGLSIEPNEDQTELVVKIVEAQ